MRGFLAHLSHHGQVCHGNSVVHLFYYFPFALWSSLAWVDGQVCLRWQTVWFWDLIRVSRIRCSTAYLFDICLVWAKNVSSRSWLFGYFKFYWTDYLNYFFLLFFSLLWGSFGWPPASRIVRLFNCFKSTILGIRALFILVGIAQFVDLLFYKWLRLLCSWRTADVVETCIYFSLDCGGWFGRQHSVWNSPRWWQHASIEVIDWFFLTNNSWWSSFRSCSKWTSLLRKFLWDLRNRWISHAFGNQLCLRRTNNRLVLNFCG